VELAAMVQIMRDYDLVLIQEVVAKDPAGAQKVAAIAEALDRTGTNWDYKISPPTKSPSANYSERYAYLWQSAKLRLQGSPYLDRALAAYCYREPYIASFRLKNLTEPIFLVNFHSRKHDDQPEEEIQYFRQYPDRLDSKNVFIAGDFNLTDSHPVWEPLKANAFLPVISEAPTTLKQKCKQGNYLNYAIDNIFYHQPSFELLTAGRVDFVQTCENLTAARGISDHLPVFAEFEY
ncbi:MAG: endonuclease/exonuclease/phosphatase family protein, partial [Bacteroidota bacterium]